MADGSVRIDITADDSSVIRTLNSVEGDAKKTLNNVEGDVKRSLKGIEKEIDGASDDMSDGIDEVGDSADKSSDELDDLGKSAEGAGKSFGVAGVAIGNFIANGLTALASKLGEAVTSLASLATETVEYREDMAKLDTAFTDAGHSTETARQAYSDFYSLLGESDRSVEAINHLAELTSNEQELAEWSTIAAGVTAKFGDSLPIEGLTEAANETAKVGAVTGPLADALNWAGVSEDEFNASLEACNSEQERATLITSTLTELYKEAGDEYNKCTADIQALRAAEAKLTESQAQMGAAMTPLIAMYKSGFAGALSGLAPHLSTISEGMKEMFNGVDGGSEKLSAGISGAMSSVVGAINSLLPTLIPMGVEIINSLISGITSSLPTLIPLAVEAVSSLISGLASALPALIDGAAMLIGQVASALPDIMQSIISALPGVIESIVTQLPVLIPQLIDGIAQAVTMLANNFGSIIEPLIAALPDIIISLVESLMNNLPLVIEGTISLVMALVEAIPQIIQGIVDALPTIIALIVSGLLSCLPQIIGGLIQVVWGVVKSLPSIFASLIEGIGNIFIGIWLGIADVFARVGEWFSTKFGEAWDAIQNAWSSVTEWFSNLWESIKDVFAPIGTWFSEKFAKAKEGILDTFSPVIDFFSNIWTKIKETFSAVGSWFSEKFTAAKENVVGAFSNIKEKFSEIWSKIKDAFNISDMLQKGKDLLTGLWNGITDKVEWLKGKVKGVVDKIKGWFTGKDGFDEHSPSKWAEQVAVYVNEGLAKGFEKSADVALKAEKAVFNELDEFVKAEQKKGIKRVADYNKDIEELEAEKVKSLLDLEEKLKKDKSSKGADRVALEKKYAEDIEKINEQHADKLAQIQSDIRSTITGQMQNVVTLGENYKAAAVKIWEDYGKAVADLQANYEEQLASRTESIANSLNLWNKAEKNAVDGKELTRNLISQLNVLEDYNEAIAKLEEREIDANFLNALKGMGVGATGEIEALVKMSDSQLKTYVNMWNKKNAYAKEAATEELEPLKEETLKQIGELSEEAVLEYQTLRAKYREEGALLMTELKQSMIDAGDGGYEELIAQVDEYESAGADLMDGVILGIVEKSPSVARAVAQSVRDAIESAKIAAGIHSPSKVMEKEVGHNLAEGVSVGWTDKAKNLKETLAADMQGITARVKAVVSAENARMAQGFGFRDMGISEIAQAVGMQTAGINSLASEYRNGSNRTVEIPLVLDGRELGRAVVDVGTTETGRIGASLSYA